MRIQSVEQNNCQRKKDVNFEALLMERNAFKLVDEFFPRALVSVADGTWGLKPHQKKGFGDLFLTQQESQRASLIGCGNGDIDGVYRYFSQLKYYADYKGFYTVSRIREAIRNGTFYKEDSNFADFNPVANLQAKVEEYCSIGGKLKRGLLRVVSEVINRKIVLE